MNILTLDTFKQIGSYERIQLTQPEPSCFNGQVRVKLYRITIEEIDETDEVITKRIQELWDANDNHHNDLPLKSAGKKYGMELTR